MFVIICNTDYSKPVKQKVNGTMILPLLVYPVLTIFIDTVSINIWEGYKFKLFNQISLFLQFYWLFETSWDCSIFDIFIKIFKMHAEQLLGCVNYTNALS